MEGEIGSPGEAVTVVIVLLVACSTTTTTSSSILDRLTRLAEGEVPGEKLDFFFFGEISPTPTPTPQTAAT